MIKLNACKFCKPEDIELVGNGFRATISCTKCINIIGGFSNKETLIKIWNDKNNV